LKTGITANNTRKSIGGTTETSSTSPQVSLPKGGGAITGIGEKFSVSPVTGTGSVSVPIYTSPGRSGFGPVLSLAYDSGAGNGPFGLGWNLSLPSITRKTDKGLPIYQDKKDSDVFILSGAEDLVPELIKDVKGNWQKNSFERTLINESNEPVSYQIQRYRPRIEGLFARIERWTSTESGEMHWRSISKDNVTTIYGKTDKSRMEDPENSLHVFSWMICESYDDKGNAILYDYKDENSQNIDLSVVSEKNRNNKTRSNNKYLKRIKYGNKTPRHLGEDLTTHDDADWMFEVVFDYGEHYLEVVKDQPVFVSIIDDDIEHQWQVRPDPFSNYRSGFEIRTYRLCQRVLMFHHFQEELGVANYLVRSTEFVYNPGLTASFVTSIKRSGYVRQSDGSYFKKSLPPIEFGYSEATIDEKVKEVDNDSLENIPYGLDGANYQWIDLDGEGLSGILAEQQQNGAWYYKRNLSSLPVVGADGSRTVVARFAPMERVTSMPSLANPNQGSHHHQLLDLTGDGKLDFVKFDGVLPGYFERTFDDKWEPFIPFFSLPNIKWNDPNLRFIDLTGDGYADILITEDEAFTWYPSLAKAGFKKAEKVHRALDEEEGPKLIFADGSESVFQADMSGDGLTDLVRIRNGEVCYWSNLGYGRFGTKITMDSAPWFDNPDLFDQRRIRLADIDGSGVTDIIYLGHDGGLHLYFNHSGNSWSKAQILSQFPAVDNLSSVMVVDLLGNGTACIVWSSPIPGNESNNNAMRYISLMSEQKPYLLVTITNNLGAETRLQYTSSTKFYLADKYAGKPWITRLPFPVHVVERVETYDMISRNRFVSRYAYHHGFFDGIEREFRGFGLVEQWDAEEFASLTSTDTLSLTGSNIEEFSHITPVLTKTWYHTGAYFEGGRISTHFEDEYYHERYIKEPRFLPDTVLPSGLTAEEEREACRALKGSILHQEIYALDHTEQSEQPYSVSERNYTVKLVQPRTNNQDYYAVFFPHLRETLDYHYERNVFGLTTLTPTITIDPRISHSMVLDVDKFGNFLKQVTIGYGRLHTDLPLNSDRDKQTQRLVIYTENYFTNSIDELDNYRTWLPSESLKYQLTDFTPTGAEGRRFQLTDFVEEKSDDTTTNILIHILGSEINYEDQPTSGKQRRLIEQERIIYRSDDLTSLLPLGELQTLALPGETYKMAFTPTLVTKIYGDRVSNTLLSDKSGSGCGYVHFPDGLDVNWWIPSGQIFYSPYATDMPNKELDFAYQHFFLPHRFQDPFENNSIVTFDIHKLLVQESVDALDNVVTTVTKDSLGNNIIALDYRVLQPWMRVDPNGNRSAVAFDALGLVVGTALMGKIGESIGDSLDGFEPDLTDAQVDAFYNVSDPHVPAPSLLKKATTRIIYDIDRFHRTWKAHQEEPTRWLPVWTAALARETHLSDHLPPSALKIQISFSYSDGFGRVIQKKIQAEPVPLVEGGPVVSPCWVGSGWTVFNNKGKPIRQYEPFFSQLSEKRHLFEFNGQVGVSSILFYDPLQRVVATLLPNHTYEKVMFNAWQQVTYDVNDTVAINDAQTGDPRTDGDILGYVAGYFKTQSDTWQTWHQQRITGTKGLMEKSAAEKAQKHANTPTIIYLDTLGRTFLTVVHNKYDLERLDGSILKTMDEKYSTRVELDVEGNQLEVRDAIVQNDDTKGRIVMRHDYDMLGTQIHRQSMEAGEQWILNDITGKPIGMWKNPPRHDTPDPMQTFQTEYDEMRRPIRSYVTGFDPANFTHRILFERIIYGEQHPQAEARNLRGKVYLQCDGAGVVTSEQLDFKGNLTHSIRRLAKEYRKSVDWTSVDAAIPLDSKTTFTQAKFEAALSLLLENLENEVENEAFSSKTLYDALNRPTQLIAPHSNKKGTKINVIQNAYNEANLLDKIYVWLEQTSEPFVLLDTSTGTPYISNIDYNAKGQRKFVEYGIKDGNRAWTTYQYDDNTFRLIHLQTKRKRKDRTDELLQDLFYTYDPIGNIMHIQDNAQKDIFVKGRWVKSSSDYLYDAVYRLKKATGREHLGIGSSLKPPEPTSPKDDPRVGLVLSNPNSLGTYDETYKYDPVGNIEKIEHVGTDPSNPGWTRTYDYNVKSYDLLENSKIEPGKKSNKLTSTMVGPSTYLYRHDAHGNMTHMPHFDHKDPSNPRIPNMHWDFVDQLHKVDLRGGGTAYYVYDASGQRARKVLQHKGSLVEERLYIDNFEVYRKHSGAELPLVLERETVHIMDDLRRIVMVEMRTIDTHDIDRSPQQLIRFQLDNHLGSAALELDEKAQIISYEEYYPYGSTSYQAVRNVTEAHKRYRYTGKERDEESGLYYHGARYYACWLGRWTRADPAGNIDGTNLYSYIRGRVIKSTDPSGEHEDTTLGATAETTNEERNEAAGEGLRAGLTVGLIIAYFGLAGTINTTSTSAEPGKPVIKSQTTTEAAIEVGVRTFIGKTLGRIFGSIADDLMSGRRATPPVKTPTGELEAAESKIIQGSLDEVVADASKAMSDRTGIPYSRLTPGSLKGANDVTLIAHGENVSPPSTFKTVTVETELNSAATPKELAKMLVETGEFKGGTLRLASCGTGVCDPVSGASYAQALSNELKQLGSPTVVIAPQGDVTFYYKIGLPTVLGSGNTKLSPGKGWEYFLEIKPF